MILARPFHHTLLLSILVMGCQSAPVDLPPADNSRSSDKQELSAQSSSPASRSEIPRSVAAIPVDTVMVDDLNIPWTIAFLPSGDMLFTERPGRLLRIGQDRKSYPIAGVHHVGEGGLLGLVLHPDFEQNQWLYLYLTTATSNGVRNRVERYRFTDDALTDRNVIIEDIPGSVYHDGGCLAFGPDGFLYITTGDAGDEESAQDQQSLAGKILRIQDDGSVPADNPFGNEVYSYGHRNPQGLTWDDQNRLWSTEHGRSGALSGYDELNMIESGKNYGWPVIQGSEIQAGMVAPVLHSGSSSTWAPASAVFVDGSVFFGGLRGEALYEAKLSSEGTLDLKTHFLGKYGRIRAAVLGPDGFLYFSTSNTDGRGNPDANDDKIVRVDLRQLH